MRLATKRIILGSMAGVAILLLTAAIVVRPSHNRRWIAGQERLPSAELTGSAAAIRNIRNFEWHADGSHTARWEDRSYNLDQVETAWFILAPFSRERRGPAHTFLSFGFADSQYLAVSVEARREVGEEYSLLKGLLRRYEMMYVIGDERDLIRLRTNVRDDDVYVYPIRAPRENVRALLVEVLTRANRLAERPEFYNTLTNNCTTNILAHANRIAPGRIPWGKEVLLPGYADQLARRLDLLDTQLSIDEARARFLVNERAHRFADSTRFSQLIRQSEE